MLYSLRVAYRQMDRPYCSIILVATADMPHVTTCLQVVAKHFLASARNKIWWMTPEFSKDIASLPAEVQFLMMELTTGTYVVICPLISNNTFRATLQPCT